jgi:hypothetical protein
MAHNHHNLRSQIEARIARDFEPTVWTPADFADLASRDAVDKTLQRLVAAGALRRIDRGLYDKPATNKLTQNPSPPDPRAIVDAVARRDQNRYLVDGMTAANDLGLTNAVPARIVIHTDARLKPIRLGNQEISFKLTAPSKLYWAGRPAMRVVQALHWLRDTSTQDGELQGITRKISAILSDGPRGERIRADLADGFSTLPAWMQDFLKPMLEDRPALS